MLIFLAEPMINFLHGPSWYWHGIRVTQFGTNDRGNMLPNLWALWGSELF